MRSIVVFLCALMLSVLGCLPRAQASSLPTPADRVEAVWSARADVLVDAYLTDPRPDPVVRAEWAPVWERWEEVEEARRDYRAALVWGEVATEDDDVLEAYCRLLEVLPVAAGALREPALCAEVSR